MKEGEYNEGSNLHVNKDGVIDNHARREMVFKRNTLNPYPYDSQSHTAWEKGFEMCWDEFFNNQNKSNE